MNNCNAFFSCSIVQYFRNHTKKTSISKGFRVAICEADLKFSANTNTTHTTTMTTTATMTTTNADDDESDSESESSDSDVDVHHNHLQVPPINRGQDESSDFIQFQRTNDDGDENDDDADAVDGANFSSIKDLTQDKRLCKPNKNRANNNFTPGSLEFNEAQPHLKLKWATLYIQMTFRPLTLRSWLDERNKHHDFATFYQKFVKKSIQQWDRTVIDQDDIDVGTDVPSQNGGSSGTAAPAAAITKYSDRNRRNITTATTAASLLSPTLEKNLSKSWDTLEVTLDIFLQVLSGLRYIHLQNIVHHDIKPSNIFIGCEKNGELYVQLGDFGLACPLETKHAPDSMIGTITYAAPEQLKGQCNKKVRPENQLF